MSEVMETIEAKASAQKTFSPEHVAAIAEGWGKCGDAFARAGDLIDEITEELE
jgi:hypothetical protein